jgi:hypothetical protein
MTRFARLVLMLALAFAQAAVAECPMAPAAHERAPAGHAAMAHAGGHSHGQSAPAHRHPAPDHGPAACALVMACGTAAVAANDVALPRPALAAAAASPRVAQLYASPFIAIDAPPPRPVSAA